MNLLSKWILPLLLLVIFIIGVYDLISMYRIRNAEKKATKLAHRIFFFIFLGALLFPFKGLFFKFSIFIAFIISLVYVYIYYSAIKRSGII